MTAVYSAPPDFLATQNGEGTLYCSVAVCRSFMGLVWGKACSYYTHIHANVCATVQIHVVLFCV